MNYNLFILLAANTASDGFNKFGDKVLGYIVKFQSIGYVLVAAALVMNGAMMIWGGEYKDKAKKNMPWVIVGSVIILGAITIAKSDFKATW